MTGAVLRSLAALALALTGATAGEHPSIAVQPGTTFHWYGLVYLAGQIHFRDAAGEQWPTFLYDGKGGSSIGGAFVFDRSAPKLTYVMTFPKLVQAGGDQRLKVLGELLRDPERLPTVRFTIDRIGAFESQRPAAFADVKDPGPYEFATATGKLQVGERAVAITAPVRITYQINPPSNGLASGGLLSGSVKLRCRFSVRGADIGLREGASRTIEVFVESHGFTEASLLAKTKKASLAELGIGGAPAKR